MVVLHLPCGAFWVLIAHNVIALKDTPGLVS